LTKLDHYGRNHIKIETNKEMSQLQEVAKPEQEVLFLNRIGHSQPSVRFAIGAFDRVLDTETGLDLTIFGSMNTPTNKCAIAKINVPRHHRSLRIGEGAEKNSMTTTVSRSFCMTASPKNPRA